MTSSSDTGTWRPVPVRQPARLLIGAYMRALRETRGIEAAATAQALDVEVSSLYLWEQGGVGLLKPGRINSLLRVYGAGSREVANALFGLLPTGPARWPEELFCDTGPGNGDRAAAALSVASRVRVLAMQQVPEPFRTPRYAALVSCPAAAGLRPGPLPVATPVAGQEYGRWTLVLDQSVLTRATGDDRVMADQLDHLLHLDQGPQVDVRVVHNDSPLASPLSALTEHILPGGALWREESFTYSGLAAGEERGRLLDEAVKRAEPADVSRQMIVQARDWLLSFNGADRR